MKVQQTMSIARQIREAAARGDYAAVAALAVRLAPGKGAEIEQFCRQMESYEQAQVEGDWRRALRALADARIAAVAANLPELETIASERLANIVQMRGGQSG